MTSLKVIQIIGKMKYAATEHLLRDPEAVKNNQGFLELISDMKELTDLIAQNKIKVEVSSD